MRVVTITPAGARRLGEQLEPVLEAADEPPAELGEAEAELLARS